MSELLLNISQMREARARVDRTYAADALPSDPDVYRLVEPVVLGADVVRDRDQFRVAGTVQTAIELMCSRCLEPFRVPVRESFDVLFLPHVEAPSDKEKQVEDEDTTTGFYRDNEIDLGQIMQEQFYLASPMKPLCRDDCRGLCSLCGINLNAGACQCTQEWQDPRLAGLRTLLKKDD